MDEWMEILSKLAHKIENCKQVAHGLGHTPEAIMLSRRLAPNKYTSVITREGEWVGTYMGLDIYLMDNDPHNDFHLRIRAGR